jgi:anti-anti-sigma factor
LLHGALDVASAPQLNELLEDLLIRGHARAVIVDLEEVGFLDSSGVKSFLRAARLSLGGRFQLRNPAPTPRRVLELMGLLYLVEE